MADDDLIEPDRAEGALHPRETPALFGHDAALAAFAQARDAGRLHSGWLVTGPQGIGKATLAYRLAADLLASPAEPAGLFDLAPPAPRAADLALIRAGAHPRLCVIRRSPDDKGKLRTQITVDDVRRLRSFFQLSAADGGYRVVIVDPADELNPNAANAILKLLEEPPARSVLFLVSHQPSRLLPTIRSRCRTLRCAALSAPDLAAALAQQGVEVTATEALAELAAGSVGQAIRLVNMDGLALYGSLVRLFDGLPRLDRAAALRLADACVGRSNEPHFAHVLDLIDIFLSRTARAGLLGEPPAQGAPGEARLLARLSPHDAAARAWATLQQDLSTRVRHGKAVNLDPASLILDMLWRIEETARSILAPAQGQPA